MQSMINIQIAQALERDIKNFEKERGGRLQAAQARVKAAKAGLEAARGALRGAEAALSAAHAEGEAADGQRAELAASVTLAEAALRGEWRLGYRRMPVVVCSPFALRLGRHHTADSVCPQPALIVRPCVTAFHTGASARRTLPGLRG